MFDKIMGFFVGDPDHVRWTIGDVYLPNIEFTLSIMPFDWCRMKFRKSHSAAWMAIGPIEIGAQW